MAGRADAHALWSGLSAEYARYQSAVSYIPTAELRLQEDLRRYLCLRCAGFIEQVTFTVIDAYLEMKSSGPVREFSRSYFPRSINLTSQRFKEQLARFGPTYERKVTEFLTKARHETLSDLLEVRNPIAHGSAASGRKLNPDRYMTLCEEIHDWLIDTFLADKAEVVSAT